MMIHPSSGGRKPAKSSPITQTDPRLGRATHHHQPTNQLPRSKKRKKEKAMPIHPQNTRPKIRDSNALFKKPSKQKTDPNSRPKHHPARASRP